MSWINTLRAACGDSSIARIATRLGYSRTTVSLALSGRYPGDTKHLARRVYEVLAVVQCTHSDQTIGIAQCQATATGRAPAHNPAKMALWRACQQCQNNRNRSN